MEEPTPLERFIEQYLEDQEAGRVRTLTEYASMFPGDDEGIAAEFLALRRGAGPAASTDPGRFGSYRLLHELGRGGQAIVWLAEDTRLGDRKVALKVLTDRGLLSDDALDRFRREAEVTSRLDHPGICTVFDAGIDDATPWIAMRYVPGETLAGKIRTSRESADDTPSTIWFFDGAEAPEPADDSATPSQATSSHAELIKAVWLVEKAARALHVAHEAAVIHRDIKPGNIMVSEDGEPVIVDFGLAREMEGDLPTLTQTGQFFGTPAYMSPEQLLAQRIRLDRRTDVWSLGVVLYECLTLQRPFEAPTREGLYQAILSKEPLDPRSVNPAIPKDLRVVLETALDKERDGRYQTALDFAEDLRRVREREPIAAKPAGPLKRLTRWAQRNPVVATMTAALFLGLAVGLVWTQFKNREVSDALAEKTAALVEKQAALDVKTRMSDVKRLANARADSDALWPVHPDLVPKLAAWKERYAPLFTRFPDHEAALARLRENALPFTDEDRRQTYPAEYREIAALKRERAEVQRKLDEGPDRRGEKALETRIEEIENRLEALNATVAVRPWSFGEDIDAQFMHDTFEQLVQDLKSFLDPKTGVVASIDERLALSRTIEAKTVLAYAKEWNDSIEAIKASPKYSGLAIKPQIGLIPLDPDPTTGYFEFLHWRSHDPGAPLPVRNAEGRFEVKPETGMILVLLPGGKFQMGAQREDAAKPNHDSVAASDESPVHEVTLDPYFMGKYEVTQAQWRRITGEVAAYWNPETQPKAITWTHPVEQVDWTTSDRFASRQGLSLPTEAQWEYTCRAGTTTPYFSGDALTPQVANIRDETYAKTFSNVTGFERGFADGFGLHAPVGSLAPNAFGLHDMHGNVWEWCLDWFGSYAADKVNPGTGLRRMEGSRNRVYRGGSYSVSAVNARSANRNGYPPEARNGDVGLRVCAQVHH